MKMQVDSLGLYSVYIEEKTGKILLDPHGYGITKMVCMMCGYEASDCDDIYRHCLFSCEVMQREWETSHG